MFSLRYFARRFFPGTYFGPTDGTTPPAIVLDGAMSQSRASMSGVLVTTTPKPTAVGGRRGRRDTWHPSNVWVAPAPTAVSLVGALTQARAGMAGSLDVTEDEDWLLDLLGLTDEALVLA
jgi:hypothetical protein